MEKEFTTSENTKSDVISRMITLWKKHREWVWDSFLLFIIFTVIFWIDKCLRPENKHLGDFFQIQNIFPILYFSPLGLVFPLVFGRKGSHISACFYLFFLLFHGIEWFCWYKFDMNLDGNIVLILKITDANEVLTFWKDILHINYLIIMIAWLLGGGLSITFCSGSVFTGSLIRLPYFLPLSV